MRRIEPLKSRICISQLFGEEALWRPGHRSTVHAITLNFVSVVQADCSALLSAVASDPDYHARFHRYCRWRRLGASVHQWHQCMERVRRLLAAHRGRDGFPSFQTLILAARPLAMPWEPQAS